MAWEVGVLQGLHERGLELHGWDLVVGTSAGAVVGAKLLGEPDFAACYAAQATDTTRADDLPVRAVAGGVASSILRAGRRRGLGWAPMVWLTLFMLETVVRRRAGRARHQRLLDRLPRIPSPAGRVFAGPDPNLAGIGALSLSARTVPEPAYLRVIRETLHPVDTWPGPLAVTAIDALTGETVAFDAVSGAPFIESIAASCAVPGLMPAVTIAGRRYIDGGMASQTHAELARGHHEVVVIAPLYFDPLAREVQALRATGASVAVVTPGPEAQIALGRNIELLDPARRARSARAGREDGRRAGAKDRQVMRQRIMASHR
jgi:NTE family protein